MKKIKRPYYFPATDPGATPKASGGGHQDTDGRLLWLASRASRVREAFCFFRVRVQISRCSGPTEQ